MARVLERTDFSAGEELLNAGLYDDEHVELRRR